MQESWDSFKTDKIIEGSPTLIFFLFYFIEYHKLTTGKD